MRVAGKKHSLLYAYYVASGIGLKLHLCYWSPGQ